MRVYQTCFFISKKGFKIFPHVLLELDQLIFYTVRCNVKIVRECIGEWLENNISVVNEMVKAFSLALIIGGIILLSYGGFQLYSSHAKESERLDEASAIVSEEVVTEVNDVDSFNYDSIEEGDTVGVFYIPRLDREIPIIEGTDEEELAQGVGHYAGTGFPGENKQILLSGHRDTVFRQFGELEHGDELHVKMEQGTFIYEIRDHTIVDADDTTVIDPTRTDEVLTVSTCYPFSYVGSAPDRYVIYAYPIANP